MHPMQEAFNTPSVRQTHMLLLSSSLFLETSCLRGFFNCSATLPSTHSTFPSTPTVWHIPPVQSSGTTLSLSVLTPCFLKTVHLLCPGEQIRGLKPLFSISYVQCHRLPSLFLPYLLQYQSKTNSQIHGENVGPLETTWCHLLLKNRALCWVTQGPVKQSTSPFSGEPSPVFCCSHGEDLL